MRSVDALVVGGGPAGAATALRLAASGRDVMVLERAPGPHHKVCGEFLSDETQAHLARLGIDPMGLGAVPIRHLAVHAGRRTALTALPFRAVSLSRFRLDEALLRRASEQGAMVRRGVAARSAEPLGSGWRLRCSDGELVHCRTLVLATGKHALRGISDARNASMVGIKNHLRLSPENTRVLAGRVELFLIEGGYVGLELVEDGIANLCLLVPSTANRRFGRGWPALHAFLASATSALCDRLDGASPLSETPFSVACPSAGHIHDDPARDQPAVYRVGDRFAHIPPFTGDGLAIALRSAALATAHIQDRGSAVGYLRETRRAMTPAVRLASAVSRIAATSLGRTVLGEAASHMPWLLRAIARWTRLPEER